MASSPIGQRVLGIEQLRKKYRKKLFLIEKQSETGRMGLSFLIWNEDPKEGGWEQKNKRGKRGSRTSWLAGCWDREES